MNIKLVNPTYTSDYFVNLLKYRGVNDINNFLNPTIEDVQNPKYLKNIEYAAEKYMEVIKEKGNIAIVVDSDCDGYTSAAIIYHYTKKLAPDIKIDYFLHSKKQHGLEDTYEEILNTNNEYQLVITPDSSSNDIEYHNALGEQNVYTLVLDHHLLDKEISEFSLLVNNQVSEQYNNKELTGAGVTWQFCRYIDSNYNFNYSSDLIDLAALGICGDMGSVLSLENRYIMKQGFANIKNDFFKALVEKQSYSMNNEVNPTTIAFYIVPLINAMIRVGTQPEKERMFEAFINGMRKVPSNKRGAKGTLEYLCIESARECTNAKTRQNNMLDKITDTLEIRIHKYGLLDDKILFVRLEDEDDFPTEINGLVAMRLAAKFRKPTLVVRDNHLGFLKGSIRNSPNSPLEDFKDFLTKSNYFEYVQGHANAAGASFIYNNIEQDLSNFHKYANEVLEEYDFGEGTYDVNFIRQGTAKDLSDLVLDLGRYPEAWGQNNPESKIYIEDLYINKKDIKIIGARADTIRFEKNGITYIQFHAKDLIQELNDLNTDEIKFNIVGHANINYWGGKCTPQLFIDAYDIENGQYAF